MIEVLFGESEAASMKVAKGSSIRIGGTDGPTSCFGNVPAEKRGNGIIVAAVPGDKTEVICLAFMLDIGDIRESVESQYRQDLIYSMYTQNEAGEDEVSLRDDISQYIRELRRLMKFAGRGEPVRIWYSQSPYSMCGLYFVCNLLQKYDCQISVVKLPDYRQEENVITEYCSWGDIDASLFSTFLQYEKVLTPIERKMYFYCWEELKEDNSPLRACVNGKVIGVPEEFYDFVIWKYLPEEPVKEARLIGNILGRCQLAIGDWWYAYRIQKMIESEKLRIVKDAERKYERIIGK